jgi:16S rRNA C1402 (ribose-2'-O) methylase RsmI
MYTQKKVEIFLIAAPIGDILSDFSMSALETLKRMKYLFIEDIGIEHEDELIARLKKRKIISDDQILLGISDPQSTKRHFPLIDDLVQKRTSFAILSDKGLPCFLDPGLEIVEYLLAKYNAVVDLIPLGASSALDGALVISGVNCNNFIFLGHYPEEHRLDVDFEALEMPAIFYIRGDSLLDFVTDMKSKLGNKCESFLLSVFSNIRQNENRISHCFGLAAPLSDFEMFDLPDKERDDDICMNNFVVVLHQQVQSSQSLLE